MTDLSAMSLHFVVLSFDRYSRDDVIGEVVCPMISIDLKQIENQQVALSKEIQPRSLKVVNTFFKNVLKFHIILGASHYNLFY